LWTVRTRRPLTRRKVCSEWGVLLVLGGGVVYECRRFLTISMNSAR